jgi:hypothetical protein
MDTYFIGEFEVTTDIEELMRKVDGSTKIRYEHQVFSSTNEEPLSAKKRRDSGTPP